MYHIRCGRKERKQKKVNKGSIVFIPADMSTAVVVPSVVIPSTALSTCAMKRGKDLKKKVVIVTDVPTKYRSVYQLPALISDSSVLEKSVFSMNC
ncbi:MAG: hypothetical protein HXS44_17865 [Theionarchaea archaeon]|nr:hypothetical protein [Theionarchaea archaeon]